MKTASPTAALAALAVVLGAPSCKTPPSGQIMLAVQTDMSLPKDIDTIRILVLRDGKVLYDNKFEKLGESDSVVLPATLGLLAPKDPKDLGRPMTIRVIASRGPDFVRVLREVVTTMPAGRTVTLQVPLQFLCDGSGAVELDAHGNAKRDSAGNVVVTSTCPEGETCIAGSCQDRTVDSATLPDYAPEEVFGGGTGTGDGACFDTATCFDGGAEAEVDLVTFEADPTTCRAKGSGDVNVGLRTQGSGICGAAGCFVALDADGDAGWKQGDGGSILLPAAVCEKLASGDLAGVVTAEVGSAPCQRKRVALPTCGPWSAAGSESAPPPETKGPIALASGQTNPLSLALSAGALYWVSGTTFDEATGPKNDGSVKMIPLGGGEPLVIADNQASPRDLALDDTKKIVVWANAGDQALAWATLGIPGGAPLSMAGPKLAEPEGIALRGSELLWTELGNDGVFRAQTSFNGSLLEAKAPEQLSQPSAPGTTPRRVAAAKNVVCWTYESSGSVACHANGTAVTVAASVVTPRALALDVAADGSATQVFFASFADVQAGKQRGGIYVAPVDGSAASAPELVAAEDHPNGLAVDADAVYWTGRTAGTVMRWSRATKEITVLASSQRTPGAIAVDAAAVYWIDESAHDQPDGTIMKLAK